MPTHWKLTQLQRLKSHKTAPFRHKTGENSRQHIAWADGQDHNADMQEGHRELKFLDVVCWGRESEMIPVINTS